MAAWLETAVWLCLGAQAYHYLGYPIVLLALARLRPRSVARDESRHHRVSLITVAYNEGGRLVEKLENSLGLDYPGLEIIAVSDGSNDDTAAVIARFAARGIVPVVLDRRGGKPSAINLAAAQARGEILVISDANALLAPDAIRKIVRNFADASVGCVCGALGVVAESADAPVGASEGVYRRYEAWIRDRESLVASTTGVTGALFAIRRSLFAPIPANTINDDLYLALKVLCQGFRSVMEPAALCWRRASRSFADEATRRRRIAAGRLQQLLARGVWPWRAPLVAFMLFSHKFLRLLLPFFMVGALAANLMLVLLPPVAAVMQFTFAVQIAAYGLALIGLVAERHAPRWRVPALAYYVVAGNLSVLHGLGRHVRGRQSVLWERVER
jgi:biofilm PGA synthesis N-glycosyltransferase PgaC